MSRTLNFTASLLSRARKLNDIGRHTQAETLLARVARHPELPPEHAEETHARLAELRLDKEEYPQARRHLAATLRLAPENARYHHLLAIAYQEDPRGDDARASRSHRRAVRLEPTNPNYLAEYGLFELANGNRTAALTAIRQAFEYAGDDANLVARLVDGLLAADESEEARSLLRVALFRNSRDRRFRNLWDDLQFRTFSEQQHQAPEPPPSPAAAAVVLPFLRPVGPRKPQRRPRVILRADAASRNRRRADQCQA